MTKLTCFKAFDPGTDPEGRSAYRIGRALAETLKAEIVAMGRDGSADAASRMAACVAGLLDGGADVLDLGLCGTEEVCHATSHFGAEFGLRVAATAAGTGRGQGLTLVVAGEGSEGAALLASAIRNSGTDGPRAAPTRKRGLLRPAKAARMAYVRAVLSYVEIAALRPLRILVDAGNGAAGPTFDAIAAALSRRGAPLSFICLNHEPGGGMEDPSATVAALRASGADFGIAFDADFTACTLFDDRGSPVPQRRLATLLTESAAARASGAGFARAEGGRFVFDGFQGCSSGMIPWLMVAELMGRRQARLADLVAAA